MKKMMLLGAACAALIGAAFACTKPTTLKPDLGASKSVKELMAARGLSEADVEAALRTYVPTGKADDYMIFASGGQSGQVLAIGVPD